MKQKNPSKREPGVNEITQIAHQAGEQIAQMQQQQKKEKQTTMLMPQQQQQALHQGGSRVDLRKLEDDLLIQSMTDPSGDSLGAFCFGFGRDPKKKA